MSVEEAALMVSAFAVSRLEAVATVESDVVLEARDR